MSEKTIICRCEDVTLREVRERIASGAQSIDEVKRLTRCGMGPCQGRTCRPLLSSELAEAMGKNVGQLVLPTFRPPAKPVRVECLLHEYDEEGSADAQNG